MSVSYTWKIHSLETAPSEGGLTDVVKTVVWRLEATDGVNTVDVSSSLRFTTADSGNFTPFDQLTESQVIGWIEQNFDMNAFREHLQKKLQDLANPPVVSRRPPWMPTTVERLI